MNLRFRIFLGDHTPKFWQTKYGIDISFQKFLDC